MCFIITQRRDSQILRGDCSQIPSSKMLLNEETISLGFVVLLISLTILLAGKHHVNINDETFIICRDHFRQLSVMLHRFSLRCDWSLDRSITGNSWKYFNLLFSGQ